MSLGCTVRFVKTLYDRLHFVGNCNTQIHHIMQGDNYVDTARGNTSVVKQSHRVAEAMPLDDFLEQMSSDDQMFLLVGRSLLA